MRVWASVEGSQPGAYGVEIWRDDEGEVNVHCNCPFDWEPACKHVVATLLAYGARQPVHGLQVADAASAAIETRAQRGRTEVAVKHVAGDPWLGSWEARSLDARATGRAAWRVEIRSVGERLNYCNCPDFAVNRLGTCKHVEAVLHRLRQKGARKFAQLAAEGPAMSLAALDWEGDGAPFVRLRPAAGGAPAWLDEFFDDRGALRGALPQAFDRLQRAARTRRTLVIVPEVEEHVRRRTEEKERKRLGERLAARLRSSGGTLPGVNARLYPYQVERFTGLEAVVVEGSPAARLACYRRRAPFTIANYEIVLRDGEVLQRELSPDLLIADEAQRIKNWRTRIAAAVKALETRFAFVLTGTPLENRLEDLYSLMQLVDSRVLGPLWRYLLDFHVVDPRGKVLGYRNLGELRKRLGSVMLRRDKSLVRDQLPERIDSRLDVELDPRQRDLHDEAVQRASQIGQIQLRRPLTPSEEKKLLSALQTARMACDAAGLVDKETVGSPKLTELRSLLEEICVEAGRKVVVFSQWERMTKMAEEVAGSLGLGAVRLHGGVPSARRGALVDRFRGDPEVQVFLSTDAGGVGLHLQAASVLINLDLPWNPAVLEQRFGRVHRLGQREPVQVIVLVARNSYEERLAGLLAAKRELFRNVVTDEATEDVVGVSKQMVEVALALLGPSVKPEAPESAEEGAQVEGISRIDELPAEEGRLEADEAAGGGLAGEGIRPVAPGAALPFAEESLASVVAHLESALRGRIERIAALGGGLVVVVDRIDAEAEALAEAAGGEVPVAVVDSRSWVALNRLGAGALPASSSLFEAPSAPRPSVSLAERKLAAAESLAEQGYTGEATALATSAMLHAAAGAAGLTVPPAPERVALWLHGELVPRGVVGFEDAGRISRGLALAGVPEVPTELLAAVLADARRMTQILGAGAGR